MYTDPANVERVAIVGAGVIGSGWAAHFLRQGLDVMAFDPAPGAEARLRAFLDDVWPTIVRLGLKDGATPERLTFASGVATAVAQAQFVQENTPEKAEVKIEVLAAIDQHAPAECVIASSTSGYAMTLLQQDCTHPERTVVGHPFNPPYLIPLVEVVGGQKTDPAVVEWAVDFYTHLGKYALKMSREIPGFVANRVQEALWREALHMIDEGMATVEEIDAAVTYGPGLRWAIMGPLLTFHLAGGAGGMGHMLDHFDPGVFESWTRLKAPSITPDLRQKLVDGCEQEANGRSIRQLEQERDACLIAIMEALDRCWP